MNKVTAATVAAGVSSAWKTWLRDRHFRRWLRGMSCVTGACAVAAGSGGPVVLRPEYTAVIDPGGTAAAARACDSNARAAELSRC
jgi:hypothetical protein